MLNLLDQAAGVTPPPPSPESRCDALFWIALGETSAYWAARAADPGGWDRFRTAQGLAAIGTVLTAGMVPGDELACDAQARAAVRAVAMAGMEADGWTPAKAMAALEAHGGQPARVLAGVTA